MAGNEFLSRKLSSCRNVNSTIPHYFLIFCLKSILFSLFGDGWESFLSHTCSEISWRHCLAVKWIILSSRNSCLSVLGKFSGIIIVFPFSGPPPPFLGYSLFRKWTYRMSPPILLYFHSYFQFIILLYFLGDFFIFIVSSDFFISAIIMFFYILCMFLFK